MCNFSAFSDDEKKAMLAAVGAQSADELFCAIPKLAKMSSFNLPEGLSELEAQKKLKSLAKKNNTDYACFLGGGAYKRFIPAAINDVASRFEFLSAYTPYQPEISQGTLEIMYEFQTMMCNLCAQDVSNASVYDGATACAEAILMACRITKKNKTFVCESINPNYLEVIKTYLWAQNIELITGIDTQDEDLACKLYQTPNYTGEFAKMPEKNAKELIIACVDLMSLALFEPPDADITVGDFQSLGLPLSFGGAYGGFIACKDAYKRQLAGRIAGKTLDADGKDAYVLTLQAREQHIRREKATSNICSNQAHCALCATLYLNLLGEAGFKKIAALSYDNAHKLAKKLSDAGFKVLNNNFFCEFVFELKEHQNADDFLSKMKQKGILAGIALDRKKILVCATELNDEEEINNYVKFADE